MRSLCVCAGVLLFAASSMQAQTPGGLHEALQARLDSLIEATAIPGVTIGVALPDGSSFGLAAGWSDTTRATPMTPDHRMLQGSVGKTYFGAVALQLVQEGRLSLNAHISEFIGREPWFDRLPNAEEVTVRQLMNHTSGLVRYELNPEFLADLTAQPQRTFTPQERLAYLFDAEAPFAAGEGWDYSDTNYIVLAMIVERITGATAYGEIEARILGPLQLDNTVPSNQPDIERLAQGYAGPDNEFGGFEQMVEDGRLVLNPQFEWGGGGFASTSQDLARWARDIHEGRAFDEALLEQVRTGVPAPLGPQGSYGLGVIMMELPTGTAWGHSGFMPGYRTEMYYFPEYRFALALQINTSDGAALQGPLLMVVSDLAGVLADGMSEGS